MILPTTYAVALLLAILASVCWGSWANTYKKAARQRFELFYWDYAVGVLVAATVAALTFGSLGFDVGGDVGGFAFFDDMMKASKHSWAYAAAAGAVFNLGAILLVAAMSLAGMSLAFPVGLGLAAVVTLLVSYFAKSHVSVVPLVATVVVVVAASVANALASRAAARQRMQAAIKSGKTKSTKVTVSWKGIVLAAIGGPIIALSFPLLDLSHVADIGIGPYAAAFMFAIGVLGSTFVYNLFFMNLPVQGQPLELLQYFRQPKKSHVLPLVGGIIFGTGLACLLVATTATTSPATGAEPVPMLGAATGVTVSLAAALLSGLWGVLVWKEYAGAPTRARTFIAFALTLLLAGLALVLLAPPFNV